MHTHSGLVYALLISALGLLPVSCNKEKPGNNIQQKVSEAYEQTKQSVLEERDEIKGTLNETLKAWDAKIDSLVDRAKDSKGQIKDEYRDAIRNLEEKRKAAADKMLELDRASAEQWQNAKDKAEAALQDLRKTYDHVASRLKFG